MLIDRPLIDRLERSAAHLAARVAETMVAAGVPEVSSAVAWCGGQLVALGPGRYLNRAIGVGAAEVTEADLGVLEAFFAERGVDPMVETSSWASPSLLSALAGRNYGPAWFRNAYVLDLATVEATAADERVAIDVVDDTRSELWRAVIAEGNDLRDGDERRVSDEYAAARHAMPEGENFLAFVDGRPAGCASMEAAEGIAWLGGAATIPAFRGRGVQTALLRHRLALAAGRGDELAAATAIPTGASARNLTRQGFQLAFVQVELVGSRGGSR